MGQKEVLLIIPAYNEEKNIGKVMDQLAQSEIANIVDVLVMNDASSDNTNWMAKQRGYAVVTHVFNLGYGSGLQLGYKYAIRRGYQYVIQMDADGQHDVCNIPKIYEKLKEKDTDENEQIELYKKMETLLCDDAANLYIEDMACEVVLRNDFAGYKFYPLYVQDMAKIYKVKE
mgnify:CR=1 FL=1